jgi:glycogen synthase
VNHFCFLALDYPTASGGGGVGNQAQQLGRALVRKGHSVSVITLASASGPREWADQGVSVHAAAPGSWHWYGSRLPLLGPLLGLPLRELEYSLAAWRTLQEIHAHHPVDLVEGSETGCLWAALRLDEVPLVIRLHGEVYSFHKFTPGLSLGWGLQLSRILQRAAVRHSDVLISPSAVHAREIAREIPHAPRPIRVIPNAIDLRQFPEPTVDGGGREPLVLFSGRLEKRKGVDCLLHAAGRLVKQVPNLQVFLAGGSHVSLDREALEGIIHDHHLGPHVRILGHVPWENLLTLYRQAAVFALPSYYETFGISALEAMASGTPVVGWAAGALPEVVEDGVSGLLVPPGEVDALADAILRLLQDPEARRRMGRAARQQAAQYDVRNVMEENMRFYEEVLHNAAR